VAIPSAPPPSPPDATPASPPPPAEAGSAWTWRELAPVFAVFAITYFLATLLRAVTATLAPVFSAELGLAAADLGLLAGAYFLGFAALQLPLGRALDRFGPRRTLLVLLALAVAGCAAFALAQGLAALAASRMLIGAGVAACLMAPLTLFRRRLDAVWQLRTNSWMLMSGSLGMLASTLPVQWLLPHWGWRGLFHALAAALAVAMVLIAVFVPRDRPTARPMHAGASLAAAPQDGGYRTIVRHPLFLRMAPLGFVLYGGMIAVQSLWAGPWLTRVAGWDASAAAGGLFSINAVMLLTFLGWGLVMPALVRRGWGPERLMAWGLPLALGLMVWIVAAGPSAGAWHWAAWCAACTFASVSQPAVGQAFDPARAGRALSAYNLVIFGGVFCVQWGLGLAIDALRGAGWGEPDAFRGAFAGFNALCAAAYVWFLWRRPDSPVRAHP
jgi:MFS family permease